MGTYRVPLPTIIRLGRAMLRRGQTSLLRDSADIVAAARPAPHLEGEANIPARGPFVAVANHCQRRGLWIGFPSALLTRAVADRRPGEPPLHWAIVAETRLWGGRLPVPGTAWAYHQVARCYEMVELPAAGRAVAGRAAALKRLARLALPPPRGRGEPIAIYPEGEAGTAAGLGPALPGTGSFLLLLAAARVPALPVGFAEVEGRLQARIGEPFLLAPAGRDRARQDELARAEVMSRIAAVVPAAMRRGTSPWRGR